MIYRKEGATARLERIRGARTLITLVERGTAEEKEGAFRCASSAGGSTPEVASDTIGAIESAIDEASAPVERLTIVAGNAHHQFGEVAWSESHVRLHASLAHLGRRISIELGAGTWSSELTAIVTGIAEGLRRCDGRRTEGSVLLAPHVTAYLWPAVLASVLETPFAAPIELRQSTHSDFSTDGYGRPIEPFVLFDGTTVTPPERWPSVYRPSYRSRPVRAAFHMRAALPRSDEACRHEGIGLLAPFIVRDGRVRARVLCSDGAIGELDASLHDLRSAPGAELWMPVGAGSWGTPAAVP